MRRLRTFSFVLACLLTLTACGGKDPEPPTGDIPLSAEDDLDIALYDLGGVQAALPARYLDQLLIVTDFPGAEESWMPLISVYEKASYEAAQAEYGGGGGFLFGFLAMDQAAFEQHVTAGADGAGITVIARDEGRFYAYTYPTDVQFCRPGGEINTESEDWKAWEILCTIGPEVREDFTARNQLTPCSTEEFLGQPFTYGGDHAYVRFYPGGGQVYNTLILSQPVQQGEGGIWCVERWMTPMGDLCPYFPDSGEPAAEYYAELQEKCGAGELPELLTPLGAARRFAEESGYFQPDSLKMRFEMTDGLPTAYMETNRRLQQLVMDIQLDKSPAPGELLDCVGRLGAENWAVLEEYAFPVGTWWEPLLAALEDAAVGANQQDRDRNMIACALSLSEEWAERCAGLSDILRAQREADPEAFSRALSEFPEDARLGLTVQITFGSNECNSDMPELVEPLDPVT